MSMLGKRDQFTRSFRFFFLGWEWLSSKSDREVGIKCLSAHMFNSLVKDSEPRKFVVKGPLNIGWILFGRWQTLLDLDGVS